MWSLGVEFQIYLVFPIILFVVGLIRRKFGYFEVLGTTLVLSSVSFVIFLLPAVNEEFYKIFGVHNISSFRYYSPIDRFWEFGIGGLFALIFYQKRRLKNSFVSVVICLMLVALIFSYATKEYEQFVTIISVTISALLLHFKFLEKISTSASLPFKWLGDRSYSLYLIHMPLIYVFHNSPYFSFEKFSARFVLGILFFIFMLFLGNFIHKVAEVNFKNSFHYCYLS
jgi:peptidoglycan/LPS O-acetylase OafA/YrhL